MTRTILILLAGLPLLVGQMCVSTDQLTEGTVSPPVNDSGTVAPGTSQAKSLTGPGFSLVIPSGFTVQPGITLPPQAVFREAYGNGERLILISTQDPQTDGLHTFEATAIRIQRTQTSDTGDFVVVAIMSDPSMAGEDMAGYAQLADGSLLCVQVSVGRSLTNQDKEFSTALFDSLSLDGTDGRSLASTIAVNDRKLLGYTDNGLIVLDDLGAWALESDATDAQRAELKNWRQGAAIHIQGAEGGEELLMIGRWSAIPVRYLGLAIKTQLAEYDTNLRQISFTNGQSQVLPYSDLPAFWAGGDDVLILRDRPYGWLVRARTWHWLRM